MVSWDDSVTVSRARSPMRRSVWAPFPVRSESSARRCSPATSAAQEPFCVLRWTDPLTASTMASSIACETCAAAALRSSSGARYIER